MRKSGNRALVLILLTINLFSCSKKQDAKDARISLHLPSDGKAEINIEVMSMLNASSSSIAKDTLDILGKGMITVPVTTATFVNLKVGEKIFPLLISPGDDMQVIEDKGSLIYNGPGAVANNYLMGFEKLKKDRQLLDGMNLLEMKMDRLKSGMDSLRESYTEFHQRYFDTVSLDQSVAALLEKKMMVDTLVLKQAFQWNYGARNDFKFPPAFDVSGDIPHDSIVIYSSMIGYALLVQMDWNLKSRRLLAGISPPTQGMAKYTELPLMFVKEIDNQKFPASVRQFLLAKNIDFFMTDLGLVYPVDSLYNSFKTSFPGFRYLSSLEKKHERLARLLPGQPAPEIKGLSMNGDSVSTYDFKNKVVYVDFWASWCGPCVDEIPFAVQLQKSFAGDEWVVFLNVSVDRDSSDWMKALKLHKSWTGLHMRTGAAAWSTYNIWGVPKYVLIDRQGNIVSSDAHRPSSLEIKGEIMKLL